MWSLVLAAVGIGLVGVAVNQVAGFFMSDTIIELGSLTAFLILIYALTFSYAMSQEALASRADLFIICQWSIAACMLVYWWMAAILSDPVGRGDGTWIILCLFLSPVFVGLWAINIAVTGHAINPSLVDSFHGSLSTADKMLLAAVGAESRGDEFLSRYYQLAYSWKAFGVTALSVSVTVFSRLYFERRRSRASS